MKDPHDLFAGAAVQRAGWLIRQNHFPAVHQGAGDTHPLLLAPGELRRLIFSPVAQPQPNQQLMGPSQARFTLRAGINRRNFDVLRRGQMR